MGKNRKRASRLAKDDIRKAKATYRANRNQKVKQVPAKLNPEELENWKRDLAPVVEEANRRINLIKSSGLVSRAVDRVEYEGGSELFNIDYVSNREELLKENTRLRVFINDNGSTIEGATLETAQINASQYKGKFGNEFNTKEHNFSRFDTTVIDKDVAARAFKSYRKIEESRAGEIKDGYGSENLIIAIYDAEIRGYDSYEYGEDLMNMLGKTKTDEWKNAKSISDSVMAITGILEDNITRGYNF